VLTQCKIKFAVSDDFIDEVELDVVPLDVCGVIFGIPLHVYEGCNLHVERQPIPTDQGWEVLQD
jgi:hypothetical protein